MNYIERKNILLFDKSKDGKDPLYIKIRDFHDKEVKERLENLWTNFCPFADSKFDQDFRDDLIPRFWEMYLGTMFIQEKKKLQKVGDCGPDILIIEPGGNKIWVEAIAPAQGEGPDKVPNMEGSGWIPEEKVILRIRSAIEEKYQKYLFYLERGYILDTEPYVIAINSFKIEYAHKDSDPSYIIQAVFPIGVPTLWINPSTGNKLREGYQHRTEIIKTKGSKVETDIFLQDKYEVISAVIYSEIWPYEYPSRLGSRVRLVHNPKAINRIRNSWLSTGIEYNLEGNEIKGINWNLESN